MTNILTTAEAANALRCETTDPAMLDLMASVDAYIRNATGHDWTADSPVNPTAKSAARMLLVKWHEDPAMIGSANALNFGLSATLTQLEAEALRYVTFEGSSGAGAISLPGAGVGDTVQSLVGVVGVSGSQVTAFETVVTVKDQIQQVSTSDLTGKFYRAYLVPAQSI
jgi:hypothetical protein